MSATNCWTSGRLGPCATSTTRGCRAASGACCAWPWPRPAAPPVLILDEPTQRPRPPAPQAGVGRFAPHQRRARHDHRPRHARRHRGRENHPARGASCATAKLVALGRPADLKRAVDQKLRLELFFSPERPPALPRRTFTPRALSLAAGSCLLERESVPAVLSAPQPRPIERLPALLRHSGGPLPVLCHPRVGRHRCRCSFMTCS